MHFGLTEIFIILLGFSIFVAAPIATVIYLLYPNFISKKESKK